MCLLAGLGVFASAPALRAQLVSAQVIYSETNVSVTTLGGGPLELCGSVTGDVDGNTLLDSQFNGPVATALNSQGTLYIADETNHLLRVVTEVGNTGDSQTTFITNAFPPSPTNRLMGLAVDAGDNLYLLVQGANVLIKYNASFNLMMAAALPSTPSALAVSLDSKTNIFVSFTNGEVVKLTQNGSSIVSSSTLVSSGFIKWQPSGLAWRPDGLLAVSDLTKNVIYLVSGTNNYVPILYTGSPKGSPGWVDGPPQYAEFNQPAALTWSADGQLVVADRSNNALRRIDGSGTTSTIYGVTNTLWGASICDEGIYAGWVDGGVGPYGTNATGRAPTSVLIAPGGNIYVTELTYSLLREVTGLGLQPVVNTNIISSTNGLTNFVAAPIFGPISGYFPACQTISVTSTVPYVFYTLNGTPPATNGPDSLMVENMTNNVADGAYEGSFQWCNSTLDLTSLELIASNGTNISAVVTGQSSSVNEIGFPAPKLGGIGSIAIVPLVINLASNQVLESVQFRVEVNPTSSNTPPITSLTLLPVSTNDFVTLAGPAAGNAPVNYQTFSYITTSNNGQGLVILASGANSGFSVQKFAAATVLEFQIPPNALPGQSYELSILDPSGTSDGAQNNVPMVSMASQTLIVSNVEYFVGDSSPANGYSAGEFGDGQLNNSDVNNTLMASVGIHVPFPGTDAFNSMDVYPETFGSPGKGFITYLDAQIILFRSLGLDTNDYVRFWTNGGFLADERITWSPGGPMVPIGTAPSELSLAVTTSALKAPPVPPGQVWLRQAAIGGGTAAGLLPGATASIPVYVKVLPGYSLAGLQFRAALLPNGAAPVPGPIQFSAAAGVPVPAEYDGLSPNETVCVWSLLDPFNPALEGSNLLGSISFQVPATALLGESYTLRFLAVGGAPDLNTLYQLESIPGSAWIATAAQSPPPLTSDEWKTNFFGSLTSLLAADNADPDGDGVPNWQEYLAGTDPTSALSNLKFSGAGPASGNPKNINLSWLTAPGRVYVLETAPALVGAAWTGVNTNLGDGNTFQILLGSHPGNAGFYRIRLQP